MKKSTFVGNWVLIQTMGSDFPFECFIEKLITEPTEEMFYACISDTGHRWYISSSDVQWVKIKEAKEQKLDLLKAKVLEFKKLEQKG